MERFKLKKILFFILLMLQRFHGTREGDMIVDDDLGLMGFTSEDSMWQANNDGETVIDYFIDDPIQEYEGADLAGNITKAMEQLEQKVCCLKLNQLKEKPHDLYSREMIWFQLGEKGSGCYSAVGRKKNRPTIVNLDPSSSVSNCFSLTTIKHEAIHSLGKGSLRKNILKFHTFSGLFSF